ncbi:hypothetical protein QEN19_000538 [Hanseniaspora menglaensis]
MPVNHPDPKKWKQPKGPKPLQRKNKNQIGLGKAILQQKAKANAIKILPDGAVHFKTDDNSADSWVKLRSITQETALDEFLTTAELADKDFTADRFSNVQIIRMDHNKSEGGSSGLTIETKKDMDSKKKKFAKNLIVPRRPKWVKGMDKFELNKLENEAFLNWRREIASLQEVSDLLMTPFERNLEVWKQLWRVVERSDLVVQIVDARDPLLFRSVDLEKYVKEVDSRKTNLLLVNKADMLTFKQRVRWAEYFLAKNIQFSFFSAKKANMVLEDQQELGDMFADEDIDLIYDDVPESDDFTEEELKQVSEEVLKATKILMIDQLEELFLSKAPKPLDDKKGFPTQIGLVGYPNVGKSSTINALVGSKKVSVSATPGKTKHFQTIQLSDNVTLCDCPGLVFPNFAYTKGELVLNGVLPIDQLRDHINPTALLVERVPKYFLEACYGIHIPIKSVEEGGDGITPTAREFLNAYSRSRGYMTQGFGSADEARGSRYVLKDYVNGKLLYVNPPPKIIKTENHDDEEEIEEIEYTLDECKVFNKAINSFHHLPETRQEQITQSLIKQDIPFESFDLSTDLDKLTFSGHVGSDGTNGAKNITHGGKQARIENSVEIMDREFFNMGLVEGKLTSAFHNRKLTEGDVGGKKHKKGKKSKVRNLGDGY